MKKMQITINKDGSTEIDLQEGFSGMSCVDKSKQIEMIVGGYQEEQRQKPEFYDGDPSVSFDINIEN